MLKLEDIVDIKELLKAAATKELRTSFLSKYIWKIRVENFKDKLEALEKEVTKYNNENSNERTLMALNDELHDLIDAGKLLITGYFDQYPRLHLVFDEYYKRILKDNQEMYAQGRRRQDCTTAFTFFSKLMSIKNSRHAAFMQHENLHRSAHHSSTYCLN